MYEAFAHAVGKEVRRRRMRRPARPKAPASTRSDGPMPDGQGRAASTAASAGQETRATRTCHCTATLPLAPRGKDVSGGTVRCRTGGKTTGETPVLPTDRRGAAVFPARSARKVFVPFECSRALVACGCAICPCLVRVRGALLRAMNATYLLDVLVLVAYFALIMGIGLSQRSKSGSVEGFALGDRQTPW